MMMVPLVMPPSRLLALSDLQRLPMMYRARLTRTPLTHVAFNPGGSCLVAAAEQQVALLGLRGCEQVDVLGYYNAPGGRQCGLLHSTLYMTLSVWQLHAVTTLDSSQRAGTVTELLRLSA